MAQRTVFVAIVNGTVAGDVLRSGLIRRLLDADPLVRVVLLTPLMRDPAFVREFEGPRIVFEDLPMHTPRGLEARGEFQHRALSVTPWRSLISGFSSQLPLGLK